MCYSTRGFHPVHLHQVTAICRYSPLSPRMLGSWRVLGPPKRAAELIPALTRRTQPAHAQRRTACTAHGAMSAAPSSIVVVAVDGPAAAGKGTLSKQLAAKLGLRHMDTGAGRSAAGCRGILRPARRRRAAWSRAACLASSSFLDCAGSGQRLMLLSCKAHLCAYAPALPTQSPAQDTPPPKNILGKPQAYFTAASAARRCRRASR